MYINVQTTVRYTNVHNIRTKTNSVARLYAFALFIFMIKLSVYPLIIISVPQGPNISRHRQYIGCFVG